MNELESIAVCELIADVCPNQRMNPGTPAAWALVLHDVPAELATVAVLHIARRSPFVAASDIRQAVDRMRTLTRRAIRQECRDRGVLVDINLEADRAIAAGLAKFDGHDLLAADADPHAYGRPTADLTGWTPGHGRELTS